ncbi:MAG: SpoVA/SpoVAEb family sporulation membrane protein [Eubacteriaceae bacterium]|nr:SpoVA/SpoVAEb family sporulation membrane protein [Eubacteriaceae bacterium]
MLIEYFKVLLVGGLLCVIAQLIVDHTKVVSAQILVIYVVAGVLLTSMGLYEPIVKYGQSGATVPLTGFGYALAKGTFEAIDEQGFIGIFSGGLSATACGVCAAIGFGFLASLVSKPKAKV